MNVVVQHQSPTDLLSKTRALLADAQTLEEVLKVCAMAKAILQYNKAALYSRKVAQEASEIRLRAERKAGELLKISYERGDRRKAGNPLWLQDATIGLPELGIEKTQSHRWQAMANVPTEIFETYIEDGLKSPLNELTTSGLMTHAKFAKKQEQAEEIKRMPPPLPTGPFRVIVADPPWPYVNRRPTRDSRGYPDYAGMSIEDIQALPVGAMAERNAILWLWTTNAFLEDAFSVCRAWGFQYRTLLTWAKNRIGLGDWLRGQTEHCLMASRGNPVILLEAQSTLLTAGVSDHSRKPAEFYSLIESLCPAPEMGRVELFARSERQGWHVWGAEAHEEVL